MTEMVRGYNFAFIDEYAKREIRRRILKAVSIPGYQVPFGSRELPIAQGWGTGGLQITLSLIGQKDILKIIDQGCDDSVNAVNIKRFIKAISAVSITSDTLKATIIQTRHRIPEEEMGDEQILVFQVPYPEPLRIVEPQEVRTRRMHAEMDYAKIWVFLYEDIVKWEEITIGARYPVMVAGRYIMDSSPIPRYDVPRLNNARTLYLFGAGREKRIYAVPPFTEVKPLEFEDHRFRTENFEGKTCELCESTDTFLDEIVIGDKRIYTCSDTSFCKKRRKDL
jgi:alpha-D-ribose 1-methylphosphonate 5-phosphate C-P lyase